MLVRTILCLIFLQSFSTPILAVEPIQFITENWPPYNYVDDGKLRGYSTEIVKLIMEDLNIKADIQVYPSKRAKQAFDNTKRAIFFSLIKTPSREKSYKWIGPFGSQSIYFYKRKANSTNIRSIEDAKKVHSICSRSAGLVFDTLIRLGFKNLDTTKNAPNIYTKAIVGRCDLAISETHTGYEFWMKKMKLPLDTLIKTPVKVLSSPLYISATKDISDKEIKRWQVALDNVLASKAYLEIAKKYGQL